MNSLRNRAVPAQVRPKHADPFMEGIALMDADDLEPRFAMTHAESLAKHEAKSYLRERYEALQCALTQPCVAQVEIPASLDNRSNGSQGTSVRGMHARAASHKAQRALGERIANVFSQGALREFLANGRPFAVVVLTRVSPRSLDGLNLDVTFKSVIDGIATGLGIDDSSPLVRYVTSQERGRPREHLVKAQLFIQPKEQVR